MGTLGPKRTLQQAMAAGPVLLDGGLATLLEAHGHDLSSDMWSARLLLDDPAEIVAAHREYYLAGAQVAITASYQASFEGFAVLGLDRGAAAAAIRQSVQYALAARDAFDDGRDRWVAASIGPYGAQAGGTVRNTAVTTAGPRRSCAPGTGHASRSWPRPAPTCWRSKRCRARPRYRRSSTCSTKHRPPHGCR